MKLLQYKGYLGSIEASDEDDVLFGQVLGLKHSLVSYEGKTLKELREDFEGAVDDYLASFEGEPYEPETPFKGSFNIRITPLMHREAVIKANEKGISLNKLVENAIEQYLRK